MLNQDLVEIGKDVLNSPPPDAPTRSQEFADPAKLVERMVGRYTAVIQGEERLTAVHVTTILFMSVKAAAEKGTLPYLLSHHRAFLLRLLDELDMRNLDSHRFSHIIGVLGKLGPGIKEWKMQGNSNMTQYLTEVVELCGKKLSDLKAGEITRIMVGLAELEVSNAERLMPALRSVCRSRRSRFKPQDLCQLAWALGRLQTLDGRELLESLAATIRKSLAATTPMELSRFVWACGQLRARLSPIYLGPIMLKIEANIRLLTPGELTDVLWALSRIPYRPRFEFLDMVEVYFANRIGAFQPADIAATLEALAVFGYAPQTLLQVSKAYILDYRERFATKEHCRMAWSLAVLDGLTMEFLKQILANLGHERLRPAVDLCVDAGVDVEDLKHLYLCALHLRVLQREEIWSLFSEECLELCRQSCNAVKDGMSAREIAAHVLHNFEYLGYVGDSCYEDPKTGWNLVCVRSAEGVRVAVELVAQDCSFVNEKHRLQGPQIWRHKILKESGWPLLIIFEDVWLGMDFQQQAEYLTENVVPLIS